MNTENHEIPVNSPVLLRLTVQVPVSRCNSAAMEALESYALGLKWEGKAPYTVIRRETLHITSLYAERPAPPEPEPVKWHNPDDLSEEIIKSGDGWRLLLKDETLIPQRTQFFHFGAGRWVESLAKLRMHDVTYRTYSPLP